MFIKAYLTVLCIARVCKKTYGFLVYNYHSIDI